MLCQTLGLWAENMQINCQYGRLSVWQVYSYDLKLKYHKPSGICEKKQ